MPEIYWTNTLNDLRTMCRLKVQHETVSSMQDIENLMWVVGKVFGGNGKSDPPGRKEPESLDEAQAIISGLIGRSG